MERCVERAIKDGGAQMLTALVVDDDSRKQAAVRSSLISLGLLEDDVLVVGDAAAARRALRMRYFDIMLLDVLIPARAGAVPSGEHSVDLLRQMLEDETSPRPAHIIGITADESALENHGEDFRELTTQVLRVDPAQDAWKASLKILVARCKSSVRRSEYDFDLVVQTALRDPEYQAILRSWSAGWSHDMCLGRGLFFRQGVLVAGGQSLRVACAHATTMGLVAATDLAGKIITNLRPRLLAMTGVCGGIGDGLAIGDLVVAEKAWDWQSGKYIHDGTFQSAADQKDASPELLAQARRLEDELSRIDDAWTGDRPKTRAKLHVAPMVSGSSVIASEDLHEMLKVQHRKVAAVDMEAFGMYFAAQMADTPAPKVICVKGISDLANAEKADWARDYCSYMSAALVRRVAERELLNI